MKGLNLFQRMVQCLSTRIASVGASHASHASHSNLPLLNNWNQWTDRPCSRHLLRWWWHQVKILKLQWSKYAAAALQCLDLTQLRPIWLKLQRHGSNETTHIKGNFTVLRAYLPIQISKCDEMPGKPFPGQCRVSVIYVTSIWTD